MKQYPIKGHLVCKEDIPLLEEYEAARLAAVAKALSDPIRVQMVHLLALRSDLCTCEFEKILELAQSKVSYHLKMLMDAGLITREINGSWSHYRLKDKEVVYKLRTIGMKLYENSHF